MNLEQLVRKIWVDGLTSFEELDRNYDPSDRQTGIGEVFGEYYSKDKEKELEAMVLDYIRDKYFTFTIKTTQDE